MHRRATSRPSIYQAVVNQTIAGLAQGRPIKGNILYLGGPLTFAKTLRRSFDRTLGVTGTLPENSLLFVAMGAAFYADEESDLREVAKRLDDYSATATYVSLPPLFANKQAYEDFHARHLKGHRALPALWRRLWAGTYRHRLRLHHHQAGGHRQRREHSVRALPPEPGQPDSAGQGIRCSVSIRDHPGLQIASVTTTGYGEEARQERVPL